MQRRTTFPPPPPIVPIISPTMVESAAVTSGTHATLVLPTLTKNQFIWVTVNKAQHPAHFIKWDGTEALVRWDNGQGEYVPYSDIITELPARQRRAATAAATTTTTTTTGSKRSISGTIKATPSPAPVASSTVSDPTVPCATVSSSSISSRAESPAPDVPTVSSSSIDLAQPLEGTAVNAVQPPLVVSRSNVTEPIPDQPVSSCGLLQSIQQGVLDVRVKQEGEQVLNSQQRQWKKQQLQAKIKANKDPGGNPRFVFRRGCHPQCISSLLGGKGIHPCPTVANVPDIGRDFIQPGDFFFAGTEAWNSFAPKYPGDSGFILSYAFLDPNDPQEKKKRTQSSFHLFVQCSKHRFHSFWHGRDAKGGYLYLGVYRQVDSRDDIQAQMVFTQLDREYQKEIAEYYVKRPTYGYYQDWQDRKAHWTDRAKAGLDEEEWNNMSEDERNNNEMRELLEDAKWTMDTVPVEFVGYNEDLYQALVDLGAAKVTAQQTGRVAIDAQGLGYPEGLLA